MPPTLRKPKALDASGQPIDPTKLYEPLSPFGRLVDGAPRVYNPGTQLRGDHEAVRQGPELWVAADVSTDEKLALRRARHAAALASVPPPAEAAPPYRIAEPRRIPFERRVLATDEFWLGSTLVRRGAQRDIDDPIVKAAPQMFRDLDGRPVKLPDEAA
jgi:hypothetical protein